MKDNQGHRVYVTGARFGQEMADRKKRERIEVEARASVGRTAYAVSDE